MSGTLGSAIQEPIFVTDEHSIKYSYVVVPSKKSETVYHTLLLVRFQQCVGYTQAQFPYAVQVKTDCFI